MLNLNNEIKDKIKELFDDKFVDRVYLFKKDEEYEYGTFSEELQDAVDAAQMVSSYTNEGYELLEVYEREGFFHKLIKEQKKEREEEIKFEVLIISDREWGLKWIDLFKDRLYSEDVPIRFRVKYGNGDIIETHNAEPYPSDKRELMAIWWGWFFESEELHEKIERTKKEDNYFTEYFNFIENITKILRFSRDELQLHLKEFAEVTLPNDEIFLRGPDSCKNYILELAKCFWRNKPLIMHLVNLIKARYSSGVYEFSKEEFDILVEKGGIEALRVVDYFSCYQIHTINPHIIHNPAERKKFYDVMYQEVQKQFEEEKRKAKTENEIEKLKSYGGIVEIYKKMSESPILSLQPR